MEKDRRTRSKRRYLTLITRIPSPKIIFKYSPLPVIQPPTSIPVLPTNEMREQENEPKLSKKKKHERNP